MFKPDPERPMKNLAILKEFSKNIKRSQREVARLLQINSFYVSRAVREFIDNAVESNGSAQKLMESYTIEGPDGTVSKLEIEEIQELLKLSDEMMETEDQEEVEPPQNNQIYQDSINREQYNKLVSNNRMPRRPYNTREDEQQPAPQYGYPEDDGYGQEADISTNVGLLRYLLENQRRAAKPDVEKFLKLFALDEAYYASNPFNLQALLSGGFPPVVANSVFNTYMAMAPRHVHNRGGFGPGQQQPSSLQGNNVGQYPNTQPMVWDPIAGTWRATPNAMGQQQPYPNGSNEADAFTTQMMKQMYMRQMEDQSMEKMMRQFMMMQMMKMTGQNPNDVSQMQANNGVPMQVRDEIKDGKVIARVMSPAPINGSGGDSGLLRIMGEQNKILQNNQVETFREMKDIFTNLITNFRGNQDPFEMLKKFKDAGLIPDGNSRSGGHPESLDAIKARLDANLALLKEKREMTILQNSWNMQREEKMAAAENTKEWVSTIKDVVSGVVQPAAEKFIEAYATQMAMSKAQSEQMKMAQMAAKHQQQQQQMSRGAPVSRQQPQGQPTSTLVRPPSVNPDQIHPDQNNPMYMSPNPGVFNRPQQPTPLQQQQRQPEQPEPVFAEQPKPSRYQQEVEKNMVNEQKLAEMTMEEIDAAEEEMEKFIRNMGPVKAKLDERRKALGGRPKPKVEKPAPAPMEFGISVATEAGKDIVTSSPNTITPKSDSDVRSSNSTGGNGLENNNTP